MKKKVPSSIKKEEKKELGFSPTKYKKVESKESKSKKKLEKKYGY